jgi:hypothetical protein
MKVKDLIESIEWCKKKYKDFDEWEVYTEQIPLEEQLRYPDFMLSDGGDESNGEDNWHYFKTCGFHTYFTDKKIVTINIDY